MTGLAHRLAIELTDSDDEALRRAVLSPLIRFNAERSGHPEDYRPLAVLLRQPGTGEVAGGLWGWTDYGHLFVQLLFIPADARGGGLGREVVGRAEAEAVRRGCHGAWLDTFSFQARGFYERLGYAVFGTLEDYPPGHSRFFLRKTLAAAPAVVP